MAEPHLLQNSSEVQNEVNAKVELSNIVRQRLENLNIYSDAFLYKLIAYDSNRASGFHWVTTLNVAGSIFESKASTKRFDAEIDASSAALTYIYAHESEFDESLLRMHQSLGPLEVRYQNRLCNSPSFRGLIRMFVFVGKSNKIPIAGQLVQQKQKLHVYRNQLQWRRSFWNR
jgi:hypothetical protein